MSQFSGKTNHDAGRQPAASKEQGRGFTLIELLVVIAIIAILAGLLLPVLTRAKQSAQNIESLSNMKQLQLAAMLYSNNNNSFLPANVPLRTGGDSSTGPPAQPNWVDGQFASANGAISESPFGCATNPFYLGVEGKTGGNPTVTLMGTIGQYAPAAGVYHSPADHYIDPTWHVERVRSCSANAFVNGLGTGPGAPQGGPNYKVFKKLSDFGNTMSASDCFVFLDENPYCLNDGWFDFYAGGNPPLVNDAPAVYGHATSFSFADGHAELHEWHDAFLHYIHPGINAPLPGDPGGSDTVWLAQHGTCLTQG